MFENLIKTALRNLKKDKFYSLLNLTGLIIGITSSIIVFVFVYNEISYDRFHADHDKIYRITTTVYGYGDYAKSEGLWDTYLEDSPMIAASTDFHPTLTSLILEGESKTFSENNGIYSDGDFLKVFDFEMISGNREEALKNLKSIVITEKLAQKFFNTTDVYGKTIFWKDKNTELTISGVLKNIPANSHLQFDFIISTINDENTNYEERNGWSRYIYFKTHDLISSERIQHEVNQVIGTIQKEDEKKGFRYKISTQKLTDIYFNATNQFEITRGGNKAYVTVFSIVGVALLLITFVNYTNLSTARSLTRIKEVGIRKTLGTTHLKIFMQFVIESILITLIASAFSVIIASWTLKNFIIPWYDINIEVIKTPIAIIMISISAIGLGILSGIYPAIKLASFKITDSLKGKLVIGKEHIISPRSTLLIVQLLVTQALILFSLVIFMQIGYMNDKDLGYNKNKLVYLVQPSSVQDQEWKLFKEELSSVAAVESVGASFFPLLEGSSLGRMNSGQIRLSNDPEMSPVPISWNVVDHKYLEVMEMELIQGRTFDPYDSLSIVINESAAKALGIDLSSEIKVKWGYNDYDVIGILKDFHTTSFQNEITPIAFRLNKNTLVARFFGLGSRLIYIRSNKPANEIIAMSEKIWENLKIDAPLEHQYFDDNFQHLLEKENQTLSLIITFTIISILITGLGLFSLIGFSTEKRKKELSIRKILGATSIAIVKLLSIDYIRFLFITYIVALPVAIWAGNKWLEEFAYKIQFSMLWPLISAGILTLIVLLVVGSKSYRTAENNPIENLNVE